MGRTNASPTPPQISQQPPQYHFEPVHNQNQAPETIEDAPPHFEISNDENPQETYENESPEVGQEESLDGQRNQPSQPQQQPQPTANLGNQTQQATPMAFPPQSWQPNASQAAQFPPQNNQMRSPPNLNAPQAFPPQSNQAQAQAQPQPQAFPPQSTTTQAFPPQSQTQPQAFPPQSFAPQTIPQAIPPQPQAFPPSQYNQQQAFPQSQVNQPQAFFPSQGKPQPFQFQNVQPQAFKQQVPFSGAGNFSQPGMVGGQTAFQSMPASPFHHNSQMMGNNTTPGIPLANQNPVMQAPTQGWRTGLFECMNDPANAVITACFPCVTFGQIAEIVDSGQTSCATSGLLYGVIACFIGMPCLISCTYRSKLRGRFGLIETPAPDWIVHCLCEWCALCQEYRELQLRGLDPAIGWLGNVAKSQQVQMAHMTPPPNQTMMA